MPRMLHLGLGNFHRAHQAWYTHVANTGAGDRWRITGVAMSNPATRDEMAAHDWTYDLGVMGNGGLHVERISVHDEVLVAAETPERVVDAIADPDVRAMTITVTEKGYALAASGRLDLEHPGIVADIATGSTQTLIGLLAKGLVTRAARRSGALTILSCDNLSGNGTLLRGAVLDFLEASGASAAILDNIRFPNTMVDRITPATTEAIAASMADAAGRPVVAPVLTEAFTEWAIEKDDSAVLPDWTKAGAVFVTDVGPYERRKLLLLNAAHSAPAYGGLLRGHSYVHEAVADPELTSHVRALWSEAAPLLPDFSKAEIDAYADALLSRFAVEGMAHRLSQIAMDGSLKLPQRIIPTVRHHQFRSPAAARVLGDWWRLQSHRARNGLALDDPMEAAIKGLVLSDTPDQTAFLSALRALGLRIEDLPDGFVNACLA